LCGQLTPGILRSVLWLNDQEILAVGDIGLIAQSGDSGKTWQRRRPNSHREFWSATNSGDGKIALIVAATGEIARSEDGGKTWQDVTPRSTGNALVLRGVALSWDGQIALAVGDKGAILRSEDGGKTWQQIALQPAISMSLNAVSIGQDKNNQTWVALAVGHSNTILRSENDGKTWQQIALEGLMDISLFSVAIQRDSQIQGLSAIIVGESGHLFESIDYGKSWKRIEPSPTTETLLSASIDAQTALVSGNKGLILRRDNEKWLSQTLDIAPNTPFGGNLHSIGIRGQKAVVVGSSGVAFFSADGGKSWQNTASRLLLCIGVSSGGQAAGGACAYRCDPAKNASDCPAPLNNCTALQTSGGSIHICSQDSLNTIVGTRQSGDICSPSIYAPPASRCNADHTCTRITDDIYRCLLSCKPDQPNCPTDQNCIYSNALGGHFCGTKSELGGHCDWQNHKFCDPSQICRYNNLTRKYTCQPIEIAKLHDHCVPGHNPCADGLICIGRNETPYRRFCAKVCNTTIANICDPGWECLATSGNFGVCLEICSQPNHKCTNSNLSCTQLQSNKQYCI
jgi:photosystem II stability/assembly factor-like uncharacterized protein